MIAGTKGYAEEAEELITRYENIPFVEKHRTVLHLLPGAPCTVLDIGAGTGADAAWFAARGHQVVAVEPTDALRLGGMALHPSARIAWVNDSLPGLMMTLERGQQFDVIMVTAVWMHLDEQERQHAMPKVASLLRPTGLLIMSLRHGSVPPRRRMFAVSAAETIQLARVHGLRSILNVHTASAQLVNRQAGVTWSHLAFGWR